MIIHGLAVEGVVVTVVVAFTNAVIVVVSAGPGN